MQVGRTLRAEEFARDVEGLAADNDDLLAVEELLGDNAGKTAEEMALAVDDDLMAPHVSLLVPLSLAADYVSRCKCSTSAFLGMVVTDCARNQDLAIVACRRGDSRREESGRQHVPLTRTTTSFPRTSGEKEGERKEKCWISQSNSC